MESIVFGGMNRLSLGIYTEDLDHQYILCWSGYTYLFADMESEMFGILFGIPPNIIQI